MFSFSGKISEILGTSLVGRFLGYYTTHKQKCKSSHRRCSATKGVLKKISNIYRKTPVSQPEGPHLH